MISPVSSSSVNPYAGGATQAAPPAAPAKPPAQQDTVQLSHAAKTTSGDADHDGDSH